VPAEIQPPELARLVDFAERPREQDWSLRSALVRYAQPQPQRVNDVLDLVRRVEWVLGKQNAVFAREGDALWAALDGGGSAPADLGDLVELLRAAQELDRLGDALATWAVDISRDRPDAEVDRVIADVGQRLDALGVPREERPPPAARRRGV
jgi:hypothetical protein